MLFRRSVLVLLLFATFSVFTGSKSALADPARRVIMHVVPWLRPGGKIAPSDRELSACSLPQGDDAAANYREHVAKMRAAGWIPS